MDARGRERERRGERTVSESKRERDSDGERERERESESERARARVSETATHQFSTATVCMSVPDIALRSRSSIEHVRPRHRTAPASHGRGDPVVDPRRSTARILPILPRVGQAMTGLEQGFAAAVIARLSIVALSFQSEFVTV